MDRILPLGRCAEGTIQTGKRESITPKTFIT